MLLKLIKFGKSFWFLGFALLVTVVFGCTCFLAPGIGKYVLIYGVIRCICLFFMGLIFLYIGGVTLIARIKKIDAARELNSKPLFTVIGILAMLIAVIFLSSYIKDLQSEPVAIKLSDTKVTVMEGNYKTFGKSVSDSLSGYNEYGRFHFLVNHKDFSDEIRDRITFESPDITVYCYYFTEKLAQVQIHFEDGTIVIPEDEEVIEIRD